MNRRRAKTLSNAVMNYLAIKGILHYRVRNTGTIIHKRGGGLPTGAYRYSTTQSGDGYSGVAQRQGIRVRV